MKNNLNRIQEKLALKENTDTLDYSKYIRDTFNICKKYTYVEYVLEYITLKLRNSIHPKTPSKKLKSKPFGFQWGSQFCG